MPAPAVTATRLGVSYNLELDEPRTLRSSIGRGFRSHAHRSRSKKHRNFWALKDVSFSAAAGDVVGLVGRNGSGKSTLLLAIAGIIEPDAGTIDTFGLRTTLLTLGAGFEYDLTGRENIYLNAAFLGIAQRQIREKIDEIIEFSELGRFIDAPLRKYSSGMRARLGFAIAANVGPEILLLDETFSVGDFGFQQKSKAKLQELIHEATLIIVATHDMNFVREACSAALWLDSGSVAAQGDPGDVADRYLRHLAETAHEPVRAVPT